MKFYYCKTIGDGNSEDTPFRPTIANYCSNWRATDARTDSTASGDMLVECFDMTEANHLLAIADNNIDYLDTSDIGIDESLSKVDMAKINSFLVTKGIVLNGISNSNSLKDLIRTLIKRLLYTQLGNNKPEGLTLDNVHTFQHKYLKTHYDD